MERAMWRGRVMILMGMRVIKFFAVETWGNGRLGVLWKAISRGWISHLKYGSFCLYYRIDCVGFSIECKIILFGESYFANQVLQMAARSLTYWTDLPVFIHCHLLKLMIPKQTRVGVRYNLSKMMLLHHTWRYDKASSCDDGEFNSLLNFAATNCSIIIPHITFLKNQDFPWCCLTGSMLCVVQCCFAQMRVLLTKDSRLAVF